MKGNREEGELASASGNFTGSLVAKVGAVFFVFFLTILVTFFIIPG